MSVLSASVTRMTPAGVAMRNVLVALTLFAMCICGAAALEPHFGWPACEPRALQSSGYIDIAGANNRTKHIFYWLFSPRSPPTDGSEAPLVMWMTGGPGCSSGIALAIENGPCIVNETTGTLDINPYGWNDRAYLLFVDQPTGVGYSYSDRADYVHNATEMADDMYKFLQGFAKRFAKPNITKGNDFYIVGESYGGHYVPSLAYRILQGNRRGEGVTINLKGIGIGNGLTDPYTQYPAYMEIAYDWCKQKLGKPCISDEAYKSMQALLPACLSEIAECNKGDTDQNAACLVVGAICGEYTSYYSSTGLNNYDIRKPCIGDLCYPMNNTIAFYLNNTVKKALGVSPETPWSTCNHVVGGDFVRDFYRNFNYTIPPLLDAGIRVLIYAGDMDFICNWIGNKAWVLALNWSGKAGMVAAQDVEFQVSSRWAGKERSYGNFSFVQIYEAGHMVPMDQPEVSLYMLNRFLDGKSLV